MSESHDNTSLFSLPFAKVNTQSLPECQFKVQPEDFQVIEVMGFEPEGEGEHLWLRLRKTNKNTQDLARELVRYYQLPKQAVSYSGLKDKNAVTEQWFSVHIPGKQQVSAPVLKDVEVLEKSRHLRKLKTGTHQANQFVIRLRDVSDMSALIEALNKVKDEGFPNYFGHQRFGFDRGNLAAAQAWLESGKRPRQRFLEGMYLSALRSYLFNVALSERVLDGDWNSLKAGDWAQFNDGRSAFEVEALNDPRVSEKTINPALALFDGNASVAESAKALTQQAWFEKFRKKRFAREIRALRICPLNMSWQQQDKDCVVSFTLPRGVYATSLLAEVCLLNEPGR